MTTWSKDVSVVRRVWPVEVLYELLARDHLTGTGGFKKRRFQCQHVIKHSLAYVCHHALPQPVDQIGSPGNRDRHQGDDGEKQQQCAIERNP